MFTKNTHPSKFYFDSPPTFHVSFLNRHPNSAFFVIIRKFTGTDNFKIVSFSWIARCSWVARKLCVPWLRWTCSIFVHLWKGYASKNLIHILNSVSGIFHSETKKLIHHLHYVFFLLNVKFSWFESSFALKRVSAWCQLALVGLRADVRAFRNRNFDGTFPRRNFSPNFFWKRLILKIKRSRVLISYF